MCPRHFRRCLFVIAGAAILWLLSHSHAGAYVIMFKDGFVIKGQIGQHTEIIVDRAARRAFSVPLAQTPYFLETKARKIIFSPAQVLDVQEDHPSPVPGWMNLRLFGKPRGAGLPALWKYISIGEWNNRWERSVNLLGPNKQRRFIKDKQRVTILTPEAIQVVSIEYAWVLYYRTHELGPDRLRKLLKYHYAKTKQKDIPKLDKQLKIIQYLARVGWTNEAYDDLHELLKIAPLKDHDTIKTEIETLKKVLAFEFVGGLKRAAKVGRHDEVKKRSEQFFKDNLDKLIDEEYGNQVFALKVDHKKRSDKLKTARRVLKQFPPKLPNTARPFFSAAAEQILTELNLDTLPRLDTFLRLAHVHELALHRKTKPDRTPKQILSYALSGWLLGDGAAKGDPDWAAQLWMARQFLLRYQQTENVLDRGNLRKKFEGSFTLGLDVLARIIRQLPPPAPNKRLDTAVQDLKVDLPNVRNATDYKVKLPREYHHNRLYPTLIVLPNPQEPVAQIVDRWGKLAADHGMILVIPNWTRPGQTVYDYSEREHLAVLNCLRDMRRRFAVDSNRVFLAGSEWGGSAAYDIGISHPDQFAGVLPMTTWADLYVPLYWSNAMYLPFYVVDGQLHGSSTEMNTDLFKTWVRWRYPALYVQYKGRGREWLGGDLPEMFDWMSHKRRYFPLKQMGSGTGANARNVFRTLRRVDNRFYWLSTSSIHPRWACEETARLKPNLLTASMWGKIFSGNEIYVYTKGLNNVSIWIAPGMIDFSKKVKVKVNRQRYQPFTLQPKLEVMLEDFYRQGDRQRLFLAKMEFKTTP